MNVLIDAPKMRQSVEKHDVTSIIRSPLAMGLLSGKYDNTSTMPADNIRASNEGWLQYFVNGRPNPLFLDRFKAVEELLRSGGRSTIQGALGWLWGKAQHNIPVPGARTVEQVEQLAQALSHGPLPVNVMTEIETLISRDHAVDAEDRER